MLVQIPVNFDAIDEEDIFYTIFKIMDGYDRNLLLPVLVLSLAIHGKLISFREHEKECRYDVRFRVLLNGDYPSYKTFEQFINRDLSVSIEPLLKKSISIL